MSDKLAVSLVEFRGKHRMRFEGVIEYVPYPKCVVFAEMHENHRQEKVFRMQLNIQQVYEMCELGKAILAMRSAVKPNAKALGEKVMTQSGESKNTLYYGLHNLPSPLYYLNMTKVGVDGRSETLNISMPDHTFLAHIRRLERFADYTQERFFALYEAHGAEA